MSHGDKVTKMPEGFKLMCSTPSCPIAGMADEKRGFYAVQFHPEVTHTVKGKEILNTLCWTSVKPNLTGLWVALLRNPFRRSKNKSAKMKLFSDFPAVLIPQ